MKTKKLALFGLVGMLGVGVATASVSTFNYSLVSAEESETIVEESESETETTIEDSETEVLVEESETEETIVDEVSEWFDKWFSAEMIAMYMSWIAYLGTIIGLVANVVKLKKNSSTTLQDVCNEIKSTLATTVNEEVANQFNEMLPSILTTQEKTNEIMSIFAKILALSQENTAESKVAILNLIEQLGSVSKEVVDNAKQVVEDGVELAKQAKEALDEKVDEIIDTYDGTSI